MENLPSFYSGAHDGFCKRFCHIAEKEVSALRLLIGLQEPFLFFLFRQLCLYINGSLHHFHSISDGFP